MARWRLICDRTGFEMYAPDAVREWTGLIVRRQDMDVRHSQEFVRGRRDRQNVPFSRPEPSDDFLTANEVTADSL